MSEDLFGGIGQKIDFTKYKTNHEVDTTLRKIFTNNPYYWDNTPLYLDHKGDLNNVIKCMLTNKIDVFKYEFPFIEPNETIKAEIALFNYCFEISKVRSNPLLPLVYFNAFMFMDKLGLSIHKNDNTSKIMHVRKNKYRSILEEINERNRTIDLYDFFCDYDNFIAINEHITCECGSVNAYRVEMGLFYNDSEYLIFPFPTDDAVGTMYYFKRK